jgi:hypothetical protein
MGYEQKRLQASNDFIHKYKIVYFFFLYNQQESLFP